MSSRVVRSRHERLARLDHLLKTRPDAWRSWYWRIEAKILRFMISRYGDFEPPLADISEPRETGRFYAPLPRHPKPLKPVSVIRALLDSIAALNPWRPQSMRAQGCAGESRPRSSTCRMMILGLIVLGIVMLCILVAHLYISSRLARARRDVALIKLAELDGALRLYFVDCGSFPTTAHGLTALAQNPGVPGWSGPYVNPDAILLDPWGMSYRYTCDAPGQFVLTSSGPDHTLGSEDDMPLEQEIQAQDSVSSQEMK